MYIKWRESSIRKHLFLLLFVPTVSIALPLLPPLYIFSCSALMSHFIVHCIFVVEEVSLLLGVLKSSRDLCFTLRGAAVVWSILLPFAQYSETFLNLCFLICQRDLLDFYECQWNPPGSGLSLLRDMHPTLFLHLCWAAHDTFPWCGETGQAVSIHLHLYHMLSTSLLDENEEEQRMSWPLNSRILCVYTNIEALSKHKRSISGLIQSNESKHNFRNEDWINVHGFHKCISNEWLIFHPKTNT